MSYVHVHVEESSIYLQSNSKQGCSTTRGTFWGSRKEGRQNEMKDRRKRERTDGRKGGNTKAQKGRKGKGKRKDRREGDAHSEIPFPLCRCPICVFCECSSAEEGRTDGSELMEGRTE
jgi:hypothetical protein